MIELVAATAAGAATLVASARRTPPARIVALRQAPPIDEVGATHRPRSRQPGRAGRALARAGGAVRRLLGGRTDARLDRAVGAGLAAVVAALLFGPIPAVTGLAAGVVVARWQRLRHHRPAVRHDDVARDLPDLVDLLALGIGAGLSVPAAIATVAPLAPAALRPAVAHAADALAGGQGSDVAIVDLGQRLGPPARPLVHALADHLRYGTPVLPALERVGAEARAARRRAAEARARRLPVLLLFPLVLCTLPAFGLLTVAPLVAGTFDSLRGGHLEAPASVAP